MRVVLLVAVMLLAGCAARDPARADEPKGDAPVDVVPAPLPEDLGDDVVDAASPFPPGIYHREPGGAGPGAPGTLRGPSGFDVDVSLPSGGFDVGPGVIVLPGENGLRLVAPDGTVRDVATDLGHVARPSLSPDGMRAVVQATRGEPSDAPPRDLGIFVVDLATGEATAIASRPYNEESPEWFPDGRRIAYSSFSPEEGVDLHVFDLDAGLDVLDVDDAGAIHLAVSDDGTRILDPGRALLRDAATGEVVADLREEIVAGLEAAGWSVDTRFPGQAGRGTFPLDGDVSPAGDALVLDGAVERDGAHGVLLFRVAADGSAFEVLSGPFEVDPAATNGLNYSETNPLWR